MKLLVLLSVLVAVTAAGCGGKTTKRTASFSAATSDCDRKGITTHEAREGICDVRGFTITVANRAHLLRVGEYDVRFVRLRTAKTLHTRSGQTMHARGTFVLLTLRVKNTLDVPVAFDRHSNLVSLRVDRKDFTENREAEGDPSIGSYRLHGRGMQPDETDTGTIVFDLPAEHAKNIYARGSNAVFINYSGESSGYPASGNAPKRLGYLRLWK
jgi:hypothetical protein